ncbi:MAG: hypothetical protein R3B47_06805 [Bacteroidia bacterium]
MELRKIKNDWLESKTQVLEVNDSGILLQSCNTLFNADSWIGRLVGDFFHLAASTFPYWKDWHEHNWVYQGLLEPYRQLYRHGDVFENILNMILNG